MLIVLFEVFFFFQAEDGIRDLTVTGVQTCALPIFSSSPAVTVLLPSLSKYSAVITAGGVMLLCVSVPRSGVLPVLQTRKARVTCSREIGRASCRKRV